MLVEYGPQPARPRHVSRDSALRRLLAVGDAGAVMLALAVALVIPDAPSAGHRILWGFAAVPLMMMLFKLYGLYDRDVKRISYSTVDDLPRLFHATVIGGLILWVYSRYSPLHRLDFAEILLFGVSVIVLVTVVRFVDAVARGPGDRGRARAVGRYGRDRPDARGQARGSPRVPARRDRLALADRVLTGTVRIDASPRSARSISSKQVADSA